MSEKEYYFDELKKGMVFIPKNQLTLTNASVERKTVDGRFPDEFYSFYHKTLVDERNTLLLIDMKLDRIFVYKDTFNHKDTFAILTFMIFPENKICWFPLKTFHSQYHNKNNVVFLDNKFKIIS